MSEVQSRVDVAFSNAVQEQLHEQREMRALVSRVEESLVAVSDGISDLSGRLSELVERSLPQMLSAMAVDLSHDIRQEMGEEIRGAQVVDAPAGPGVSEAITQVAEATQRQVEGLANRVDAVIKRLDAAIPADETVAAQTETALAGLHSKMQADADAVLDALASRAEEVLDGVGSHSDSVLSDLSTAQDSLRVSLTQALQQVQGDSLDRLEDIAVRLMALGPRLERQGSDRIAGLQARFESLELALLHQVGDLKSQTSQTQTSLSALSQQMSQMTAVTSPSSWSAPHKAEEGGEPARSQPPVPPPAPSWVVATQSTAHTCPHCGYVARTAPGLAAHRANCPRRQTKND